MLGRQHIKSSLIAWAKELGKRGDTDSISLANLIESIASAFKDADSFPDDYPKDSLRAASRLIETLTGDIRPGDVRDEKHSTFNAAATLEKLKKLDYEKCVAGLTHLPLDDITDLAFIICSKINPAGIEDLTSLPSPQPIPITKTTSAATATAIPPIATAPSIPVKKPAALATAADLGKHIPPNMPLERSHSVIDRLQRFDDISKIPADAEPEPGTFGHALIAQLLGPTGENRNAAYQTIEDILKAVSPTEKLAFIKTAIKEFNIALDLTQLNIAFNEYQPAVAAHSHDEKRSSDKPTQLQKDIKKLQELQAEEELHHDATKSEEITALKKKIEAAENAEQHALAQLYSANEAKKDAYKKEFAKCYKEITEALQKKFTSDYRKAWITLARQVFRVPNDQNNRPNIADYHRHENIFDRQLTIAKPTENFNPRNKSTLIKAGALSNNMENYRIVAGKSSGANLPGSYGGFYFTAYLDPKGILRVQKVFIKRATEADGQINHAENIAEFLASYIMQEAIDDSVASIYFVSSPLTNPEHPQVDQMYMGSVVYDDAQDLNEVTHNVMGVPVEKRAIGSGCAENVNDTPQYRWIPHHGWKYENIGGTPAFQPGIKKLVLEQHVPHLARALSVILVGNYSVHTENNMLATLSRSKPGGGKNDVKEIVAIDLGAAFGVSFHGYERTLHAFDPKKRKKGSAYLLAYPRELLVSKDFISDFEASICTLPIERLEKRIDEGMDIVAKLYHFDQLRDFAHLMRAPISRHTIDHEDQVELVKEIKAFLKERTRDRQRSAKELLLELKLGSYIDKNYSDADFRQWVLDNPSYFLTGHATTKPPRWENGKHNLEKEHKDEKAIRDKAATILSTAVEFTTGIREVLFKDVSLLKNPKITKPNERIQLTVECMLARVNTIISLYDFHDRHPGANQAPLNAELQKSRKKLESLQVMFKKALQSKSKRLKSNDAYDFHNADDQSLLIQACDEAYRTMVSTFENIPIKKEHKEKILQKMQIAESADEPEDYVQSAKDTGGLLVEYMAKADFLIKLDTAPTTLGGILNDEIVGIKTANNDTRSPDDRRNNTYNFFESFLKELDLAEQAHLIILANDQFNLKLDQAVIDNLGTALESYHKDHSNKHAHEQFKTLIDDALYQTLRSGLTRYQADTAGNKHKWHVLIDHLCRVSKNANLAPKASPNIIHHTIADLPLVTFNCNNPTAEQLRDLLSTNMRDYRYVARKDNGKQSSGAYDGWHVICYRTLDGTIHQARVLFKRPEKDPARILTEIMGSGFKNLLVPNSGAYTFFVTAPDSKPYSASIYIPSNQTLTKRVGLTYRSEYRVNWFFDNPTIQEKVREMNEKEKDSIRRLLIADWWAGDNDHTTDNILVAADGECKRADHDCSLCDITPEVQPHNNNRKGHTHTCDFPYEIVVSTRTADLIDEFTADLNWEKISAEADRQIALIKQLNDKQLITALATHLDENRAPDKLLDLDKQVKPFLQHVMYQRLISLRLRALTLRLHVYANNNSADEDELSSMIRDNPLCFWQNQFFTFRLTTDKSKRLNTQFAHARTEVFKEPQLQEGIRALLMKAFDKNYPKIMTPNHKVLTKEEIKTGAKRYLALLKELNALYNSQDKQDANVSTELKDRIAGLEVALAHKDEEIFEKNLLVQCNDAYKTMVLVYCDKLDIHQRLKFEKVFDVKHAPTKESYSLVDDHKEPMSSISDKTKDPLIEALEKILIRSIIIKHDALLRNEASVLERELNELKSIIHALKTADTTPGCLVEMTGPFPATSAASPTSPKSPKLKISIPGDEKETAVPSCIYEADFSKPFSLADENIPAAAGAVSSPKPAPIKVEKQQPDLYTQCQTLITKIESNITFAKQLCTDKPSLETAHLFHFFSKKIVDIHKLKPIVIEHNGTQADAESKLYEKCKSLTPPKDDEKEPKSPKKADEPASPKTEVMGKANEQDRSIDEVNDTMLAVTNKRSVTLPNPVDKNNEKHPDNPTTAWTMTREESTDGVTYHSVNVGGNNGRGEPEELRIARILVKVLLKKDYFGSIKVASDPENQTDKEWEESMVKWVQKQYVEAHLQEGERPEDVTKENLRAFIDRVYDSGELEITGKFTYRRSMTNDLFAGYQEATQYQYEDTTRKLKVSLPNEKFIAWGYGQYHTLLAQGVDEIASRGRRHHPELIKTLTLINAAENQLAAEKGIKTRVDYYNMTHLEYEPTQEQIDAMKDILTSNDPRHSKIKEYVRLIHAEAETCRQETLQKTAHAREMYSPPAASV